MEKSIFWHGKSKFLFSFWVKTWNFDFWVKFDRNLAKISPELTKAYPSRRLRNSSTSQQHSQRNHHHKLARGGSDESRSRRRWRLHGVPRWSIVFDEKRGYIFFWFLFIFIHPPSAHIYLLTVTLFVRLLTSLDPSERRKRSAVLKRSRTAPCL